MKAISLNLDDLLGARVGRPAQAEKPMPLPEAQIMELRNFKDDYGKNPFAVGDVLQPRKRAGLNKAMSKRPWIVVESLGSPLMTGLNEGYSSSGCLHRVNVRLAVVTESDGEISTFWHAAHDFEPYTGDMPE